MLKKTDNLVQEGVPYLQDFKQISWLKNSKQCLEHGIYVEFEQKPFEYFGEKEFYENRAVRHNSALCHPGPPLQKVSAPGFLPMCSSLYSPQMAFLIFSPYTFFHISSFMKTCL